MRPDLPPVANPAADPYLGAEEFPTYRAVDAEGVVKALVPVTSGSLSLTRQQTPAAVADRETPETRRLVRAIYGQPQTADISREAFSGKGIRIRV